MFLLSRDICCKSEEHVCDKSLSTLSLLSRGEAGNAKFLQLRKIVDVTYVYVCRSTNPWYLTSVSINIEVP